MKPLDKLLEDLHTEDGLPSEALPEALERIQKALSTSVVAKGLGPVEHLQILDAHVGSANSYFTMMFGDLIGRVTALENMLQAVLQGETQVEAIDTDAIEAEVAMMRNALAFDRLSKVYDFVVQRSRKKLEVVKS